MHRIRIQRSFPFSQISIMFLKVINFTQIHIKKKSENIEVKWIVSTTEGIEKIRALNLRICHEILYLAIKLFIELITFKWWQKIIEKPPSCPAMTKKTSRSINCPGGGCSELWAHAKWLARQPWRFYLKMIFPKVFGVWVYLCFNNYYWKISLMRLNCPSIMLLRENHR